MQNPRSAKYHGLSLKFAGFRARCGKIAATAACLAGMSVAQAGELSLSWQDNSDNEDGFEIERALPGEDFGLVATVGADAESYLDQAVLAGREYEYRVRAFNAYGYSGYTNVSVGFVPNTAPVVGEIEDISILKGEAMPVAEFSYSDAESSPEDLVVEALSSNLSLVPLTGIAVSLEGGAGSVSLTPNSSATGVATITLLVSDGVELTQQSFDVEVKRNLAPTVGSMQAVNVYDGQQVGPVSFTISDSELAASDLTVVGLSMDESLIASESISIGGSGASRTVSFATKPGVSGTTTVRMAVSDGVNTTNGVLTVNITRNAAPVITGLDERYTIEGDGEISGLAFGISDRETASSSLSLSVRSSNSMLVSQFGMKLKGSGSQRTLDVTPNPGMTGTVVVTVAVSDGVHTTEHAFELRVLAPEQVVNILGFSIEQSLAVVEVENREGASFSLWKIHSLDGAWEKVADAEATVGESSTILIDPTPVDSPVCYRVIASE